MRHSNPSTAFCILLVICLLHLCLYPIPFDLIYLRPNKERDDPPLALQTQGPPRIVSRCPHTVVALDTPCLGLIGLVRL